MIKETLFKTDESKKTEDKQIPKEKSELELLREELAMLRDEVKKTTPIKKERKKREFTEEQREQMGIHMKAMREKQKNKLKDEIKNDLHDEKVLEEKNKPHKFVEPEIKKTIEIKQEEPQIQKPQVHLQNPEIINKPPVAQIQPQPKPQLPVQNNVQQQRPLTYQEKLRIALKQMENMNAGTRG